MTSSSPSLEYLRRRVDTLSERLTQAVTEQARQVLRIEELEGMFAVRTEERDQAREQLALALQEAEALRACVEAQRSTISEQLAQLDDKDEQIAAHVDYAAELGELMAGGSATEPAPPVRYRIWNSTVDSDGLVLAWLARAKDANAFECGQTVQIIRQGVLKAAAEVVTLDRDQGELRLGTSLLVMADDELEIAG